MGGGGAGLWGGGTCTFARAGDLRFFSWRHHLEGRMWQLDGELVTWLYGCPGLKGTPP